MSVNATEADGKRNTSRVVMIVVVATFYFATGQLGLLLAVPPGYATVIWPPSGLALGMLLAYGRNLWPGVFLGSFVLNAAMGGSFDGLTIQKAAIALAIAGGSTLQAIAAEAAIARFFGRPMQMTSGLSILGLIAIAGPLACIIASSVGTSTLVAAGAIATTDIVRNWSTWWTGDILGIVVFAPLVLITPWHRNRIQWRSEPIGALPTAAILTLLLPLGLTFYAWKGSSEYIYKKNDELFASLALENERALFHRLDSYKQSMPVPLAQAVAG